MALEEWKLKLNSTNVEVEVEAELDKKMFTLKAKQAQLGVPHSEIQVELD